MPHDLLTRAQTDALPDSSFALIKDGGRKDHEGKTIPRSLRLLPFKDSSGEVNAPLAFRALGLLNSSAMDRVPTPQRVEAWDKVVAALKRRSKQVARSIERGEFIPPPRKF